MLLVYRISRCPSQEEVNCDDSKQKKINTIRKITFCVAVSLWSIISTIMIVELITLPNSKCVTRTETKTRTIRYNVCEDCEYCIEQTDSYEEDQDKLDEIWGY